MSVAHRRSPRPARPTVALAGTVSTLLALLACGGATVRTEAPPPVAAVVVIPPSPKVEAGLTVQLTATPEDASGHPLPGRAVTWASSDANVATVSPSGLVEGKTAGWAAITAASEGSSGTAAITVLVSTPAFEHVFIVIEENRSYERVIDSAGTSYLQSLAHEYGLATQYYANTHPSIGNYFMTTAGRVVSNNDGYEATVTEDNIVRQLLAAGKTWRSYAEDLPSVGFLGSGFGTLYARRHNPLSYFSDVVNDPVQRQNLVPFTQFAIDLAGNTLPNYSFIVPNLCDDAHDCPAAKADAWLQQNIDPLIQSAAFRKDGLLIITFDESINRDTAQGGGHVVWVAVSSKSKRSYRSTTLYQHESTLRLTARALRLTVLPGAAATAPIMSEFFEPDDQARAAPGTWPGAALSIRAPLLPLRR